MTTSPRMVPKWEGRGKEEIDMVIGWVGGLVDREKKTQERINTAKKQKSNSSLGKKTTAVLVVFPPPPPTIGNANSR